MRTQLACQWEGRRIQNVKTEKGWSTKFLSSSVFLKQKMTKCWGRTDRESTRMRWQRIQPIDGDDRLRNLYFFKCRTIFLKTEDHLKKMRDAQGEKIQSWMFFSCDNSALAWSDLMIRRVSCDLIQNSVNQNRIFPSSFFRETKILARASEKVKSYFYRIRFDFSLSHFVRRKTNPKRSLPTLDLSKY